MKVSWDDEIPNWMGKNMFQTTNQISALHTLHGLHESLFIFEKQQLVSRDRSGSIGIRAVIEFAPWNRYVILYIIYL